MKQQIKHRYTNAVLFECDVPDDVSSGLQMRHALEKAVSARANLEGANLEDANLAHANLAHAYLAHAYLACANLADANLAHANLEGANLEGANLADAYLAHAYLACANLEDANLADANLADANLEGANLAHANLARAYLACANLADANLEGANLEGANLEDAKFLADKLLIGKRPYMAIGPIGSRCAMVTLWITDKGPMVNAGCFTGTLKEFAAAVTKTHGANDHAKEYEMAILMFESHCSIWTPEVAA